MSDQWTSIETRTGDLVIGVRLEGITQTGEIWFCGSDLDTLAEQVAHAMRQRKQLAKASKP